MLTIKTGMQPEAAIAKAHASKGTLILTGIQTEASLQTLVPTTCTAILSFGLCGGLRPNLPIVGQTLIASSLTDPNKEIYVPDQSWNHRLFAATHAYTQSWFSNGQFNTADTPAQRQAIYKQTGAWCIDDESLAVAQFAQARKIPFAILRTVSDAWNDNVAITGKLLNAQGGVDIVATIKAFATDPEDMIKIWRDYNLSIAELGTAAIEVGPSFQWLEPPTRT